MEGTGTSGRVPLRRRPRPSSRQVSEVLGARKRPADTGDAKWLPVTLGGVSRRWDRGDGSTPDTGSVIFPTPMALMSHFADVLRTTPVETEVSDSNLRIMKHALSKHPDAATKVGPGVSSIAVKSHATKGYRYFEITRVDGTADDVSFRKCVDVLFPGFGRDFSHERGTSDGDKTFVKRTSTGKTKSAARVTSLITESTSVRGVLRVMSVGVEDLDVTGVTDDSHDSSSQANSHKSLSPDLDKVHVAAAFVKIGKLVSSGYNDSESNCENNSKELLTSSKAFIELVQLAKTMCADGRLNARATANIIHAIAKTANSGVWSGGFLDEAGDDEAIDNESIETIGDIRTSRLSNLHDTASGVGISGDYSNMDVSTREVLPANVYGLVTALEQRVEKVANAMTPQAVANTLWGFGSLRWELGDDSWDALQAAVVRCGEDEGDDVYEQTVSLQTVSARKTFNAQEVSISVWGVAKMGWSPDVETWCAIDRSVERTAGTDMTSKAIAMTFWSYATLGQKPEGHTLHSIERRIIRLCDEKSQGSKLSLSPRDISNILWSFVTLEIDPSVECRNALDRYCVDMLTGDSDTVHDESNNNSSTNSPKITPADLANQSWALSALTGISRDGRSASSGLLEAIEVTEIRLCLANQMAPSDVSNAMLGIATNKVRKARVKSHTNGRNAWRALETQITLFCDESKNNMTPQDLANAWYAFASVGLPFRNAESRKTLESATALAAPQMAARHVSTIVYAYAKLGLTSTETSEGFLKAMSSAATRIALKDEMNAQNIAQTLWAFSSIAVVSGDQNVMELSNCTRALWDAARELDVRSTLEVTLCTFFHAHLMCEELLGGSYGVNSQNSSSIKDKYPSWIQNQAKKEWIQNVNREVDVSRTHSLVAETLREMSHERKTGQVVVECLTADEFFSLDIYLPELDVGVEVDGPTHYFEKEQGEGGHEPSHIGKQSKTYSPTLSTKLRDAFLQERCAAVIVVPWFDFDTLANSKQRSAYLVRKLQEAGIEVEEV